MSNIELKNKIDVLDKTIKELSFDKMNLQKDYLESLPTFNEKFKYWFWKYSSKNNLSSTIMKDSNNG